MAEANEVTAEPPDTEALIDIPELVDLVLVDVERLLVVVRLRVALVDLVVLRRVLLRFLVDLVFLRLVFLDFLFRLAISCLKSFLLM